ncbi:MAG: tetratricopeptide repeat protein [Caldilineaceae bacterium]|nr:tetratricopeptide repeat protein [Caldilineaceae bacterium]
MTDLEVASTDQAQEKKSKGTGDGGTPRRLSASYDAWILLGLVVLLVAVLLIQQYLLVSLGMVLSIMALLAIIGVFPAAYFAYRAYRQAPVIERLKREFELMGLVERTTSTTAVEELYNIVHSPRQYYWYITLIVLLSLFIFLTTSLRPSAGPLSAVFSVMETRQPEAASQTLPQDRSAQASASLTETTTLTPTSAMTTINPSQADATTDPASASPPLGTPDNQADSVLNLIFIGYLGAYFYSVRELTRRYNTYDLQPQVYSSILMRMLVAIVLVFVGSSAIVSFGPKAAAGEPDAVAGYVSLWAPAIIAFLIGAFPDWGLRWFKEVGKRVLGPEPDTASVLPLQSLLGISQLHASRLEQMGIDDAQNLAGEDLRNLLLTTPFAPQVLVNWIDQAILFTKVGSEDIKRYRAAQITSFYELQMAIATLAREHKIDLQSSSHDEREGAFGRFATQLGMADVDELIRVSDYANFPNYNHIKEYYANIGSVIHNLAVAGKDRFIGVVVTKDFEAAIGEGERLIDIYGGTVEPIILLGLGEAYYKRGLSRKSTNAGEARRDFESAIRQYSAVLAQGSGNPAALNGRALCYIERDKEEYYLKAVQDCTQALMIDRAYVDAINTRSIAYLHLGETERCKEDILRALEMNPRLPSAYYVLGILHTSAGQYADALDALEKASLTGDDDLRVKVAQGTAYLRQGAYKEAVATFSDLIFVNPDDTQAYALRGIAYRLLGPDYADRAIRDLGVVIKKDDSDLVSHYNMAMALDQQDKKAEARVHFQKVLDLDPQWLSDEARAARSWLSRNTPA